MPLLDTDLARYARIPFRLHGRDHTGCDCWGLVRLVLAEQAGVELPSYAEEYAAAAGAEAAAALAAHAAEWEPVDAPRAFDVVLLRLKNRPQHVGVMVDGRRFLHVLEGRDVTLEEWDSTAWRHRVLGFYRYSEVPGFNPEPGTRNSEHALRLLYVPNPFGQGRLDLTVPEGGTVADLVALAGAPEDALLSVWVDDTPVPREQWAACRPGPGRRVLVRAAPLGGGSDSNKLWNTILSIVVMAVSYYIGGPFGAVFSVGGLYLVNEVFPLGGVMDRARPRQQSSTYSLLGHSNRSLPYQPVWRLYGRLRLYPPWASEPYYELKGQDQYLHLLLDCGYGPLRLDQLYIGDTPVQTFGDSVQYEFLSGAAGDPPLTLFGEVVETQTPNITLQHNVDHIITSGGDADRLLVEVQFPGLFERYLSNDGKMKLRETFVNVEVGLRPAGTADPWDASGFEHTEITIDSSDVLLLEDFGPWERWGWDFWNLHWGQKISCRVTVPPNRRVRIEYVEVYWFVHGNMTWYVHTATETEDWSFTLPPKQASHYTFSPQHYLKFVLEKFMNGAWVQADGEGIPSPTQWRYNSPTDSGSIVRIFRANSESLVRFALHINLPERGQYDVRLRRTTPLSASTDLLNTAVWTQLQTIRYVDPTAAVRGRHALLALRVKASEQLQGMLDQVNGVFQSLLRTWDGAAWTEPLPTSSPAWAYCDVLRGEANGRPVADSRLHLADLKEWGDDCAAEGREFNGVFDFKGTVFETLKAVAACGRADFGKRDGKYSVVRDRLQTVPVQHFTPRNSWGFTGSKAFPQLPHALRMRYKDASAGWLDAERVVYADGYDAGTATRFEVVDVLGMTDGDQVWKEGRYHQAVAQLRPESFVLYTDFEHLVCTRGDLVTVTHDVPLWGLGSGRLKGVTRNGGGQVVSVTLDERLTLAAGTRYALRIRLDDLSQVVHEVTNPGAGEVTSLAFVTPFTAAIQKGDLFSFGELGSESADLLVTRIEPKPDLSALLTLVDAAPAVHTADQGPIPPYDPQITLPPLLNRPPPPAPTLYAASNETLRAADGTVTVTVLVPFAVIQTAGAAVAVELQGQARRSGSTLWSALPPVQLPAAEFPVRGLETGATYELRFRAVSALGLASAWVTVTHQVVADTTPPAAPTSLSGVFAATARWTWDKNTEIDFSHFAVSLDGVNWAGTKNNSSEIAVPEERAYTLRVKAVDRSGNESEEASLELTLPEPTAPAVNDFVLRSEWNVVTIDVTSSHTRAPAHTGYLFRWTPDGGSTWNMVNTKGVETVTFAVPLSLIAAAGLLVGCSVAETDSLGASGWSDTEDVLVLAQSTNVQSRRETASTTLKEIHWEKPSESHHDYLGSAHLVVVPVAPTSQDMGIVVDGLVDLSTTQADMALRVMLLAIPAPVCWGHVTTGGTNVVIDSAAAFQTAGVQAGDYILWGRSGSGFLPLSKVVSVDSQTQLTVDGYAEFTTSTVTGHWDTTVSVGAGYVVLRQASGQPVLHEDYSWIDVDNPTIPAPNGTTVTVPFMLGPGDAFNGNGVDIQPGLTHVVLVLALGNPGAPHTSDPNAQITLGNRFVRVIQFRR